MRSLGQQLLLLEEKLLDPALRRTPENLAPMLADDFLEFGSSGRTFDKKQILYLLRKQFPARRTIEQFRVTELGTAAALVTYRACAESPDGKAEKYSLRSSVWVLRGGEWQMVFHQGTAIPG